METTLNHFQIVNEQERKVFGWEKWLVQRTIDIQYFLSSINLSMLTYITFPLSPVFFQHSPRRNHILDTVPVIPRYLFLHLLPRQPLEIFHAELVSIDRRLAGHDPRFHVEDFLAEGLCFGVGVR